MTTLRDEFKTTHEKNGFTYISWSQAADRLDEAEPGWSFAVVQVFGQEAVLGRLTFADGRFYDNIGYAENADAQWKKEPLKDAVSDAFKRCAALAGVGRYLYPGDEPTTRNGAASSSVAPAAGRATPPRPAATTTPPEPDWMAEASAVEVARTARGGTLTAEDEGTCPQHGKPWRENSKGFYCATKNGDGTWCDEKPTQRWVSNRAAVGAGR